MKKDAFVTFGEMAKTYGQQYVTPDLTLPKYPANVFRLKAPSNGCFLNLLEFLIGQCDQRSRVIGFLTGMQGFEDGRFGDQSFAGSRWCANQ